MVKTLPLRVGSTSLLHQMTSYNKLLCGSTGVVRAFWICWKTVLFSIAVDGCANEKKVKRHQNISDRRIL